MFVSADVHYEDRNASDLYLGGYNGRDSHAVMSCRHNDMIIYGLYAASGSLLEYLYTVVNSFSLKTYHNCDATSFKETS